MKIKRSKSLLTAGICALLVLSPLAQAKGLTLAVQPILSESETREAYRPLAAYLSKSVGQPVEIVTSQNFLTTWRDLKRGKDFSMVIFGAHLTDVMHESKQYEVVAKVEGSVSMSLVTHEDTFIFEPEELIGQKVATMAMPSTPAIILGEMFPDPIKSPVLVVVDSSAAAVEQVMNKTVVAAVIPSPMVGGYPGLNVISTTDPTPHIAVSVSPNIDPGVRDQIRDALVMAKETPEGQAMLKRVGIGNFESADSETYQGFSDSLAGIWMGF